MKFKKEQIKNGYILDTAVENIFINEYMLSAPGEYVKIYMLALMYTQMGEEAENETIAMTLSVSPEEVEKAWKYWHDLGVIKRKGNVIEFCVLKDHLYGRNHEADHCHAACSAGSMLEDLPLKSMYKAIEKSVGRPLSGTESSEIITWIEDYGASPEMVAYAYVYCASKKKDNVRYVGAVVKDWASQGLVNVLDVENFISENDERHYIYKRIMKALGFSRNATEEERRIIDRWVDEKDCTLEDILDACKKTSGIPNPNINYVNKVITGRKSGEKTGRAEAVAEYYGYLREKAEKEAEQKKQEVYLKVPRIKEIEEEMKRCSMELSRAIVSGSSGKRDSIKRLQEKGKALSRAKKVLLTENDFPGDYMEVHYACGLCKDTGTKDSGERCVCFPERAKEADEWIKDS